MDTISIDLCVNDKHGNLTDDLWGATVEYGEHHAEFDLAFDSPAFRQYDHYVVISDEGFSFRQWARSVGNVSWNRYVFDAPEALRLLNWLHFLGDVDEATTALFEKAERGEKWELSDFGIQESEAERMARTGQPKLFEVTA